MTTTSGPLARDPDVVNAVSAGAVYPRPTKGPVTAMPRWPLTWRERFDSYIQPDPDTGCHLWLGTVQPKKGYGTFYLEGKMQLAHRVAFYIHRGRWPAPGLVTDHICNRRRCVNPAHLRELTNGENIQRAYPRGTPEVEAQRAMWRRNTAALRARRAVS